MHYLFRVALHDIKKGLTQAVKPVNPVRGIDSDILRDFAQPMVDPNKPKVTEPAPTDVTPADAFKPKPPQVAVLNLAQTGQDSEKTLETKVPLNKGFSEYHNLSQYLVPQSIPKSK